MLLERFLTGGKLLTNKLMKQEYQQSCSRSSFCKFYGWYYGLSANTIYHRVKCWLTFFIPIVSPLFIHWIDDGFFPLFPDHDNEHTAGVTCRQGMLTPPWHLIPPLMFRRSVFALLLFCILFNGLWDWILFVISIFFLKSAHEILQIN